MISLSRVDAFIVRAGRVMYQRLSPTLSLVHYSSASSAALRCAFYLYFHFRPFGPPVRLDSTCLGINVRLFNVVRSTGRAYPAPRAAKLLHVVVRARDDFHSCSITRIASIYFYRSKSTHERYVAQPVCGIETRGMPRAYDSVLVSL